MARTAVPGAHGPTRLEHPADLEPSIVFRALLWPREPRPPSSESSPSLCSRRRDFEPLGSFPVEGRLPLLFAWALLMPNQHPSSSPPWERHTPRVYGWVWCVWAGGGAGAAGP